MSDLREALKGPTLDDAKWRVIVEAAKKIAEPVIDKEVEGIALERHRNQRPKCYEFFGNEDDGCYCIVNTRIALEAFMRGRFGDA